MSTFHSSLYPHQNHPLHKKKENFYPCFVVIRNHSWISTSSCNWSCGISNTATMESIFFEYWYRHIRSPNISPSPKEKWNLSPMGRKSSPDGSLEVFVFDLFNGERLKYRLQEQLRRVVGRVARNRLETIVLKTESRQGSYLCLGCDSRSTFNNVKRQKKCDAFTSLS